MARQERMPFVGLRLHGHGAATRPMIHRSKGVETSRLVFIFTMGEETMRKHKSFRGPSVALLVLAASSWPGAFSQAVQSQATSSPVQNRPAVATTSTAAKYAVFAFNDLGMHCYDGDFSVFSLLPPFNVFHAQVIKKGLRPKILDDKNCRLFYSSVVDPSGSINTTSEGKTNFWEFILPLYGVNQPLDAGILGALMPGPGNMPQPMGAYDPAHHWFTAAGVPFTCVDDDGLINPYPMVRVKAVAVKGRKSLGALDIVVPNSNEMNCLSCHVTGQDGASDWHAQTYNVQFCQNPDQVIQYRENILLLHDGINGTRLYNTYTDGQPVLCAGCHYSRALDLNQTGPNTTQASHLYLSHAIHSHHGMTLDHQLPGADNPPILSEDGAASCYNCHPGGTTNCLRGVMSAQQIVCQDCHGGLLALGGVFPLAGGTTREPWADLPKCQSCHTGDAVDNLDGDIVCQVAYDPEDSAATPIEALNDRFAENPGQLYRNSNAHWGVACESCHGSPHAEWPAQVPTANDNVTPLEIQRHGGPVAECDACHDPRLAASMGGPHGMHNVNSRTWMNGHMWFYWRNADSCRACHGLALEGTNLARVAADRILSKSWFGRNKIAITQGTAVSCAMCHGSRYH
ncbi:MAG: cytochrome C [bacterium]|nr:cytochrome C [bacterium]